MKREDVKNKIPGITEDQLNWLMQENGNDINREKSAADQFKAQLSSVTAQLKTAQEGLAKFDGVNVDDLNAQITKLKSDMQAQAESFAFGEAQSSGYPYVKDGGDPTKKMTGTEAEQFAQWFNQVTHNEYDKMKKNVH